jgi:hypothetical protein
MRKRTGFTLETRIIFIAIRKKQTGTDYTYTDLQETIRDTFGKTPRPEQRKSEGRALSHLRKPFSLSFQLISKAHMGASLRLTRSLRNCIDKRGFELGSIYVALELRPEAKNTWHTKRADD